MKELSGVPVELYVMMFDAIQSSVPHSLTITEYKATLAALCLVCRMFCEECQPRLFESVTFRGDSRDTQRAKLLKAWHHLLAAGDPQSISLAHFVRECTLASWSTANQSLQAYYTAFLHRNLGITTSATVFNKQRGICITC